MDEPTIVYYVTDLLTPIAARVKAFSRHYRIDFSKTIGSSYWMNHSEHCGMKQGDFEMYCEPEGAFFPTNEYAAAQIVLYTFNEQFGCNGGAPPTVNTHLIPCDEPDHIPNLSRY